MGSKFIIKSTTALLSLALTPRTAVSFNPSASIGTWRCLEIHTRISPRSSKNRALSAKNLSPPSNSRGSTHSVVGDDRPPCPRSLTNRLEESVDRLQEWFQGKSNILCLTGAGISTDSGIPDYRGHNGSYHKGHKPMIHDEFMNSHKMRQRYWGRAMVGWRDFSQAIPNEGHMALAKLESMGKIGVTFEDSVDYYKPNCEDSELKWAFSPGYQRMTIITQNVDGLHLKAGSHSNHVTELHGRNNRLVCMTCGSHQCRHDFHNELDILNASWLQQQLEQQQQQQAHTSSSNLRPDGDAFVVHENFHELQIPHCTNCSSSNRTQPGFLKPDVVFFGDSVPKYRVNRCYAAVDAADGLLCIGSSLAVHSAYRFVQRAAANGIPIAVLNVGETRAELNGLELLKIEAPAGPTLQALVTRFETGLKRSDDSLDCEN